MAHMDIRGRVEGANLEIKGLICRFGGSLGRVGCALKMWWLMRQIRIRIENMVAHAED